MSRLLYQAELHRRVTGRPGLSTGPLVDPTSPFTESNRRPSPYHGDALPTELKGRCSGAEGTLPSRSRRPADPPRTVRIDCNSRVVTDWNGPATRLPGRGPSSGADEQPAVPGSRRGAADPRAGQQ